MGKAGMEDPNKPKHYKMKRELVEPPPRNKDMTWEQKCRISALRAACASTYVGVSPPEDGDEWMTARILARAEVFRIALMSDGALDYTPDDDEAPETIEGTVSQCTRCLRAITWFRPSGFEGRWIDSEGVSRCHNNDRSYGDHTIEPIVPELCPGCGASSRKMPLWIDEQNDVCRHKWHQS